MFTSGRNAFLKKTSNSLKVVVRFQSSSSNASSKVLLKDKEQKILHKKRQQHHHKNDNKSVNTLTNNEKLSSSSDQGIKLKKGFSNVIKVPSTINLEPRDVLLDKLYQGYNPLLSPISPKVKKSTPKILVNIYEDLSFEDEGFENDEVIGSMVGPKLQISKYIFDQNPDIEAKLKKLSPEVKQVKNGGKIEALFEKRTKSDGKRGRVRLQYKKKDEQKIDKNEGNKDIMGDNE